ncbi:MAG: archaeosine biosynthesis radical SAM protein RaSEA [archaeon]|nr:archaeosine biosynthesis radical SAM protein RaSEA [archaeon]
MLGSKIEKESITEEIKSLALMLRNKSRDRKNKREINLMRPVASWIKKDRIHSGVGNEFTIILRTIACEWARSESGGCTMCGYFNDRGPDTITQEQILAQINSAFEKQSDTLSEKIEQNQKIAIKIFTSGSFLDNNEINPETREKIFKKISEYNNITEVIVESRPEFISKEKILPLKNIIGNRIFEIGVGLESSNKFIREILINKGFSLQDVENSIKIAHESGVLIKAYLLLKPPFVSEKIAIQDAIQTIKKAIEIGVDSISLNPVNIQANTIAEYLFFRKKYRSPWIYSVIQVFRSALTEDKMQKTLILCDPSAAGKERGVHNCNSKDCNHDWLNIVQEFVFTQDLNKLQKINLPYGNCQCWNEYNLFLEYIKY